VHLINRNADAAGYTLQASEAIRPDVGVGLEYTRIEEGSSTVDLAWAGVSKRLGRRASPQIWAFTGVRYLQGEDGFREFSDLAAQIGLALSAAASPGLRVAASAGFSFFENTLTELEIGIWQDLGRSLMLGAGYKTYLSGDESVGGPTISLVWRR